MKAIILISFLALLGCNLNESLVNSIGEQAKSVIDKANNAGGQAGIDILEDEIDDLEAKIDKKEKEYRKIKKRIEDRKDEIDELEDEIDEKKRRLDDIETELEDDSLPPEERTRLEEEARRLRDQVGELEGQKADLESQIATLEADKTQAETERDQAKTDLEAMKRERDSLKRKLATAERERDSARSSRNRAIGERDTARTERDCWKKTKTSVCNLPDRLKNEIVSKVSGKSDCDDIHYCDLETITSLDLSGSYETGSDDDCNDHKIVFEPDDFTGLIKLEDLILSGVCLSYLESFTSSRGFFSKLTSIKRINLSETDVNKLSNNFFNGVINTLEDDGVTVQDFIVCDDAPYKDKLSGDITTHNDNSYRGRDMSSYCY